VGSQTLALANSHIFVKVPFVASEAPVVAVEQEATQPGGT